MAEDPHGASERRLAARHLLQRPLTCAEHDPDVFTLIRRHGDELDRWFTQRLGYRLQVTGDTARLVKTGTMPADRPLRITSGRPLHQIEHVLLALTLAATVAGPAVVSLRDLIDQVRSAAADAGVTLADDGTQRRAQVAVLRWMIDGGLAIELHNRIDAYNDDAEADAVLQMRPDRIALLPLPAMVDADDGGELLERAARRPARRAWLRCRLVEDPVLYRHELTDDEWDELRRRQADEAHVLEDALGLVVEARAEGVAAIDPAGTMSGVRFPSTGTVGHAALLFIGELCRRGILRPAAIGSAASSALRSGPDESVRNGSRTFDQAHADQGPWLEWEDGVELVSALSLPHSRRWKADLIERPEALLSAVVDLLVPLRLVEARNPFDGSPAVRLLPAAARFREIQERRRDRNEQPSLL